VLIEWGDKKSKKNVSKELSRAIHAKAAPVIKWLKEAEEESSEEEEEEVRLLRDLLLQCGSTMQTRCPGTANGEIRFAKAT